MWLVVDGFYGKRPLVKLARKLKVVLVSGLRKNAALRQAILEEEFSAVMGSGPIPPKILQLLKRLLHLVL